MASGSKRNILIAVGMILGGIFLYLAFRDVSWHDLVDGVSKMKPIYFMPCLLLTLMIQLVRAIRFGIILRPFCPFSTKQLWDLLNIWAAASMIMPARLGELVRPYLLQRRGVSFSSVLGAVMVERFFDLSGLLLLLGIVLWSTPEVPQDLLAGWRDSARMSGARICHHTAHPGKQGRISQAPEETPVMAS